MRRLAPLLALLAAPSVAAATAVEVHAGTNGARMYLDPADIRVDQGVAVALTVVNDDKDKPHDWALLSYGGKDIEAYTSAGGSKTITFTASHAGTYRVVCQVEGHKQLGMEGRFIVHAKSVPAVQFAAALVALALTAVMTRRGR